MRLPIENDSKPGGLKRGVSSASISSRSTSTKRSVTSSVSFQRNQGSLKSTTSTKSSLGAGIEKYMDTGEDILPPVADVVAAQLSEGRNRLFRGIAGLRFMSEMETEFLKRAEMRNRRNLCLVWLASNVYFIAEFFIMCCYERLGHSDTAVRISGWSRVATCMILLCWPVLVLCHLIYVDTGLILAAVVCSSVMQLGSLHRMSKMYETDFCDKELARLTDSYIGVCDDDIELWIPYVLLTCMVHMLVEVRAAYSWILPFIQLVLYLSFSIAVDSAPLLLTINQTVLLGLIGCLCWASRFRNEVRERRAWINEARMQLRTQRQQAVIKDVKRRLTEIEEMQEVMRVPEAPVSENRVTMNTMDFEAFRPSNVESVDFPEDLDMAVPDIPNVHVARAMSGKKADGKLIMQMARRIRDRSYTLKNFCDDSLHAFPELTLFQDEWQIMGNRRKSSTGMSSGLTASQEYQRTFGALFAVYWLLRLDIDGKVGFCFGVDGDWKYPDHTDEQVLHKIRDAEKRLDFLHDMKWEELEKVVQLAKIDNPDRIAAMLCLTAIHDIMKVEPLCPTVQPEHGPYCGYRAGTVINDHDIAISYVLDKYPHLLPSYNWLPAESRRSIFFTQSKLGFNHGWFVQAEVPPGIMLATFKREVKDHSDGDIGFYFVHWLTDLAGAQGTPLHGAEKFVCKFPRAVLQAFLWSIPYLQRLLDSSETAVVEGYLEARWLESLRTDLPSGRYAVAEMRLAVMAQGGVEEVLNAFRSLPNKAKDILGVEMARTGLTDQHYNRSPVCGGPAFSVYYGPALLQRCQKNQGNMRMALMALVQVYVAGRQIWPVNSDQQGQTVTLQIGQLKAHDIGHVYYSLAGERRSIWILMQVNENEAMCDLCGALELNELNKDGTPYCVLDLSEDETQFDDYPEDVYYESELISREPSTPPNEEDGEDNELEMDDQLTKEEANCTLPPDDWSHMDYEVYLQKLAKGSELSV